MRVLGALTVVLALALAGCGGGSPASGAASTPKPTPTPAPTAAPTAAPNPLALLAAAMSGHYAGTWTNTTFGSTGPIAVQIAIDPAAGTLTASNLTIGGNVFGAAAPPPETLVLSGLPTGTATGRSPSFGDVTVQLSPTGGFSGTCANIPSARVSQVQFNGTLTDPTKLSLTYKVALKDGTSADGTVTLAKG